jgi:hypothetical protein
MDRKPRVGSPGRKEKLWDWENPDFVRNSLKGLSERAATGDPDAKKQIGKALADHPEWKVLIPQFDALTAQVEGAWIKAVAGKDPLAAEALRAEIAAMKEEMAGPNPSVLERILLGNLMACHLAASHASKLAAEVTQNPALAAFRDRRLESAQRRLAAAVKTWQQFRRQAGKGLALPPGVRLLEPPQSANGPSRRRARSGARRLG